MNAPFGPPRLTRAADGIGRRSFTIGEIEAMQAAGIFHPEEKFELIEGDLIPMQANNNPHERVKVALILALSRALPDHLWLGVESAIRLSPTSMVLPDICVYPRRLALEEVRGSDLLAVIEVGDSSLAYDRGLKRKLYARHKVPLYWSIDAVKRTTLVLTKPREDGDWEVAAELGPDANLVLPALGDFTFRLTDVP
jgi:Uma2 family endonuclease